MSDTLARLCEVCHSRPPEADGERCGACALLLIEVSPVVQASEFPLHVLPDPLANFVQTTARAGGFPLPYCGAALFPVAAVALGERRTLVVDPDSGWKAPPILYVPLVGPTGQGKSPVMKIMTMPLVHLDDDAHAMYELELETWGRTSEAERKKLNLRHPKMRPWLRTDITIERLSVDLLHKRSILAWYDELTEWARSLTGNRYGNNASINRSKWLALWGGERFDRVRIGTDREDVDIHIPNPRVSLLGGIQPMLMGEVSQGADGMWERMLPAYSDQTRPPKRQGVIEDADWWNTAIRRAATLDTREVLLDPAALALAESFRDEMYESNWEIGAIPKVMEHCHRLALVLGHLWMHYEAVDRPIHKRDMENSIELSRWFYSQREQLEPHLLTGGGEERVTLLTLERLKDYLLRKEDENRIVLWRVVLQNKIKGCHTTQLLTQAMQTLEALEFAKEVTWQGKKAIKVYGKR